MSKKNRDKQIDGPVSQAVGSLTPAGAADLEKTGTMSTANAINADPPTPIPFDPERDVPEGYRVASKIAAAGRELIEAYAHFHDNPAYMQAAFAKFAEVIA